MTLRISEEVKFVDELMLMSGMVLGMPESGKTSALKVLCEEVWKIKQRFGVIDPKGDYYGLGSTADGQSAAIPVVVFGGEHAHVPIEPNAGRFIANVVAKELQQPFVIDVESFSKNRQIIFVADFLEELYHINRDPLMLVIDEVERFAPEKSQFPEAHRCLGAVQDVFSLGRKHGLGRFGIAQRGAEANKSVVDKCDLGIFFRATGVLDQKRVRGWLEANVRKQDIEVALDQLPELETGQCIIASARKEIKLFKTVHVRQLETFDTSKTPGLKRRRREPKILATPDLALLHHKMQAQLEQQRANDPKALRAYVEDQKRTLQKQTEVISQLQAQLANAKTPREKIVRKEMKVPVLDKATLVRFVKRVQVEFSAHVEQAAADSYKLTDEYVREWTPPAEPHESTEIVERAVNRERTFLPERATPMERTKSGERAAPVERTKLSERSTAEQNGEIRPGMQKILDTLAWAKRSLPSPELDKVRLAHMADQSPRSGGYFANLAALKRLGYIDSPRSAVFIITDDGWRYARDEDMTGAGVREQIYAKLKASERSMVTFLLQHDVVTKRELADATGQSSNSGGYFANLARLKALKLIESPAPAMFRAADFLREP
jgi:uncharacterized protein